MITYLLIIVVFPLAMAFAAAYDLFSMTIPNWISLILIGGFILLASIIGLSWSSIGLHVALACGALIVSFTLFSFGWIGGGDAKLFAATCLWLGPEQMLLFTVYAALLGGALTLAILIVRSLPLPEALGSQGWISRLYDASQGIPYGIALAAAGLIIYPHTPFMAALGL